MMESSSRRIQTEMKPDTKTSEEIKSKIELEGIDSFI